jgi:hypothetical protein
VTETSRTYIDDPDKSTKFYKGMARKRSGDFAGCKDPTLTIAPLRILKKICSQGWMLRLIPPFFVGPM